MSADPPFFSVVVPVLNGGDAFGRTLASIGASAFDDRELIVVDDGSTDGSTARAAAAGARVLATAGRAGPAAARNLGARNARGRYLFFLDADCELHDGVLERAAALLRADPGLDAVFGSYDADPPAPGLVSRYRNLLHHWVHHRGRREAATFWAGCGAVRRAAFEAVGGFDAARYPRASIEDIDLGVRLRARGARIRLAPDLRVRHHKAWTLGSMLRTDALRRAAPWTRLALRSGGFPRDLNTGTRERAALAALVLAAAMAVAAPWRPLLLVLALAGGVVFVLLHRELFGFLRRRGGTGFAALSVPLHALHVLAGGFGLIVGAAGALAERFRFERRGTPETSSKREPAAEIETRNTAGPSA